MPSSQSLQLDPDRLLPPEPALRRLARSQRLEPAGATELYRLARTRRLTDDQARALRRHLVWEMAGFIDDTRAFCSIPARHDMSRRLDAGYLAQLVGEGRLDEDEAAETAIDLVSSNPRKAFRL